MPRQPLALVTGANRGLGLETAHQLVARGVTVLVAARRQSDAEGAAREVGGAPVALDVTDALGIARVAAWVEERWGHLDILVNNAGVALRGFDAGVVSETFAVNVHGVIAVTDALLPLLSERGHVVMVSSGMGSLSGLPEPLRGRFASGSLTRGGLRDLLGEFHDAVAGGAHSRLGWPSSAYSISKVAVGAFTRILARELSGSERAANAVCPGWVQTDMGGPSASRTVEEGARGIVAVALLPPGGPSGQFFRDGRQIDW